jgi:hypothetical protein
MAVIFLITHEKLNMRIIIKFFLVLFSISLFFACKGDFEVPLVSKTDRCEINPENTYDVFIPKRNKSIKKLPVLLILDSEARGEFALNHFKTGAEKYPVITISSNYIKNNFEGYETAIHQLIDDVRKKYPASNTIYLSGFSGCARMIIDYAAKNTVDGLISCGALASPEVIKAVKCPVISITGMADFNFGETAQYLFSEEIPENLNLEIIEGKHEWPDSITLERSLGFLYLSTNKDISTSFKNEKLKEFDIIQEKRIAGLKKQNSLIKAISIAGYMSKTELFNIDNKYTQLYNSLKSDHNFNDQLIKLRDLLMSEMNVRPLYIEAFSTKDISWWRNEINTADKEIFTAKDHLDRDMFMRMKGFWGIACYSICNQAIHNNDKILLGKVLSVYRELEPGNQDMLKFTQVYQKM